MTTTKILEVLYKERASLRDIDQLVNPTFSNIIYMIRKEGGDLGDLIAIIRANQLPETLDFEHLEEKVFNHYE